MPFWECTITLQDVACQLGLPIDGDPVSGCLTDFENLMENERPAWVWFRVLPADASKETVRIYARAYILMLLTSQLFADKNANRVHLRWLPYLALMDDLDRWATYLPRNDAGNQRVVSARLSLDRLRFCDVSRLVIALTIQFVWEPYSSPKVDAVGHPEILVDEYHRLWTAVTSLIYFAVIEWHQVDRVVSQFGGVQHLPQLALNIDWLHAKDGRGGDRWFPKYYQEWHFHWENRVDSVIPIGRVADPGPLAEYLDWWCRLAHRFLSQDVAFHNPRSILLTEEARHRGSSQAPPRVQVLDRLDKRRVDRRRHIGTRTTDREWRWLDDRLDEDLGGADDGGVVNHRVPRCRARRQGGRDGRGRARGKGPSAEDDGAQYAVGEDVGGLDIGMDQPTYDVGGSSQLFGSVGPQVFADFTTVAVGMDIDNPISQSEFFRDIADMLRDDDATYYRPQMPEVHSQFAESQPPSHDVQPQLPVDLNEPTASPSDPWFALGGTPASAFSTVPPQTSAPKADQRPRRMRRPPLCGTGGHLLSHFDDDDSDTIEDSD
ncbi:hypothetical protein Ahy_B09g097749 isoform B [Arachis hypogaea]|uniref:Aminotransferase-like plant mobile domain-containing protein n=1 Tax=Arachis hypogaea TaxID=3818 RepID=A0A444XQB5_ARAHY|nr:hypothetical protein Ahy_B09g097749 isoform B [Arachis hypogaea]